MNRRYVIGCGGLGIAAFLAVGVWDTYGDLIEAADRIRKLRAAGGGVNVPMAPFVVWGIKYVLFYILAGAVMGVVFGVIGHLLVKPKARQGMNGANGPSLPVGLLHVGLLRGARRSYLACGALLAGFLVYVHLRMLTLHPALFDSSYRFDWFVGNPMCVMAVWAVGRVAAIVIGLVLLRKYAGVIGEGVKRVMGRVALLYSRATASLPHGRASALRATALVAGGIVVLAVCVVGFVIVRGGLAAKNVGPNVIVIALDSVRPDHLSWKGLAKPYPRATTPNIDGFLDDSVWFDQAFTPIARTYPSWAAILTGCWPPSNGVRDDLMPKRSLLPRAPTMAQAFQRAGYRTAFFLDNTNFAWIEPALGFDEIVQPEHNALDFYVSSVQPLAILYYYFLNNRLGYLYDPGLRYNAAYRAIYRPEVMNAEIAHFLARMRSEPKFFQAIHLCTIHVPLTLSYPASTWFRPSFGPTPNRFGYRALLGQIFEKKESGAAFTAREAAQVYQQEINLYDALLRSADAAFGEIIEAIKREGLYDNSYIVFMADHGEHLPAPGLRYRYRYSMHGFFMWGDQDTRVPLAIKFPKRQYAGRRVERLVRTIDLAPTLLAATGLPALGATDGVSRMPDVRGGRDDRERWTYGETGLSTPKVFIDGHLAYVSVNYPDLHEVDPKSLKIYLKDSVMPNVIAAKDRMIRTERWKAIAYPIATEDGKLAHKIELFDVAADPNCRKDLATSQPEALRELRSKLMPFIQRDLKEFGTGPIARFEQPDAMMTGSF